MRNVWRHSREFAFWFTWLCSKDLIALEASNIAAFSSDSFTFIYVYISRDSHRILSPLGALDIGGGEEEPTFNFKLKILYPPHPNDEIPLKLVSKYYAISFLSSFDFKRPFFNKQEVKGGFFNATIS